MCGQKSSATKVSIGEEHRLQVKLEAQIKQIPDLPCVAVGKSLNLSEFPFPDTYLIKGLDYMQGFKILF